MSNGFDTPRSELIRFAAAEMRSGQDAVTAINITVDGGSQMPQDTLGYAMWRYLRDVSDTGFTRLCKAVEREAK